MDDLLTEFLTETSEHLEVIDSELVRFEADPSDLPTLNNIFRLVHTIKGTCGFLGLPRLEGVAHAGETLLGRFRDGALPVTPEAVSLVLAAIDRIKEILVGLEASGSEPAGDDSALINKLHAAAEGKLAPAPAPAAEAEPVGPNGEKWDKDLQRFLRPGEVTLAELEAAFAETESEAPAASAPVAPAPAPVVAAAPAPTAAPAGAPAAAQAAPKLEAEPGEEEDGKRELGQQTIRVNLDVLEQLMTMVSELVLTRNQLMQIARTQGDSEFKAPLQRLSHITAELQDRVMKTRMQPVGSAWRKLPRIVRDICRETGKKIDLKLEGEATELDRQVLELIKDPLTHMIRNSADHGIEKPEARLAAGKPEMGTITLSARHEGGHIIMEVADDGAGLKTSRIREKAIEKGIVGAAEAASMSDQQIQRLIFTPGFSTASTVTNLSGRGVGMDVVKTNIELIGGSIELSSVEGKGVTFRIKIPLTLAIVSALIVGARGHRFACPQTAVLELVRVGAGCEHRVETINQTPILRLRDELLPLLSLGEALRLPSEKEPETQSVVVMQVGASRFGVIVEDVHDTEEIVVKPLSTVLRGTAMLSGATILGDGSVVVILDPNGLCERLGAQQQQDATQTLAAQEAANAGAGTAGMESLVLFQAGEGAVKAVPLMLVTRLEDIDASQIEFADGRFVLQYRGELMPVLHAVGPHAMRSSGKQPLLVFTGFGRPFGLAVDRIIDIAHDQVRIDLTADRPGVLGVAVVRGVATEIIDVSTFVQNAQSDWSQTTPARSGSRRGRVLLLDQSEFARNLLKPLIAAAGYEVETAPSAEAAWRLHESGLAVDAILADVDADQSAAEDFARRLAQGSRWAGAPLLPLSERNRDTGLGASVVKLDRQHIIAALEFALRRRDAA